MYSVSCYFQGRKKRGLEFVEGEKYPPLTDVNKEIGCFLRLRFRSILSLRLNVILKNVSYFRACYRMDYVGQTRTKMERFLFFEFMKISFRSVHFTFFEVRNLREMETFERSYIIRFDCIVARTGFSKFQKFFKVRYFQPRLQTDKTFQQETVVNNVRDARFYSRLVNTAAERKQGVPFNSSVSH